MKIKPLAHEFPVVCDDVWSEEPDEVDELDEVDDVYEVDEVDEIDETQLYPSHD